jgi:hypothetical protein
MYNPIAPPEYKSVYVDHKLDVIAQNARDRYDTNLEAKNQLDRTIGAMRVNPGDQRIVDAAKQNVKDFIGSANSFELMGPAVDAALTSTVSNKVLTDSLESYKIGQEEDLLKRTLAAKNKLYDFETVPKVDPTTGLIEKDPITGQNIMVSKKNRHDTETQGIYSPYAQEKLPLEEKMTSLAAQINAESLVDGDGIISKAIFDADVSKDQWNHWLKTQQGVSSEKINAVVDSLISTLEGTPEGDQMLKAYQEIIPTDDGLRLHTEAEAKKKLKDAFTAIAMKHKGITAQIFQSWEPRPEPRVAKADEYESPEDLLQLPEFQTIEPILDNINEMAEETTQHFDTNGTFIGTDPKRNAANLADFMGKLNAPGSSFYSLDKDYLKSEEGSNGLSQAILAGTFGNVDKLRDGRTDAQFVKEMIGALKTPVPETTMVIDKEAAYKLLGSNPSSNMVMMNGKLVPLDTYIDKYKAKLNTNATIKANLKEALKDAEYSFCNTGPNAGLFKVVVPELATSMFGGSQTIYMQPLADRSFADHFQGVRETYKYNTVGTVGKAKVITQDPQAISYVMNGKTPPKGAKLLEFNVIEKDSSGGLVRKTYRDVAVNGKYIPAGVDAQGRPVSGRINAMDKALQDSQLVIRQAIAGSSLLADVFSNFYKPNQKRSPPIPKP